MKLSYGIPGNCSDEGGCGNALCFSCYPDDSISQLSNHSKTMKTLLLATIAISTTATTSIAVVPLVEPRPTAPVTTIATSSNPCPVGAEQGPRHPYCLPLYNLVDSIAYKPAQNPDDNPKTKGPKIGSSIVAEGIDVPTLPRCTQRPCLPGSTTLFRGVVAIEDGGAQYGALFQVPFAV